MSKFASTRNSLAEEQAIVAQLKTLLDAREVKSGLDRARELAEEVEDRKPLAPPEQLGFAA